MATLTTLSAAQGVNDQTVLLASLTGILVGSLLFIDGEVERVLGPVPAAATTPVSVLRGQEATFNQAHPVSAQVKIAILPSNLSPGDFPAIAPPGALPGYVIPPVKVFERRSYSAAGAITLP